MQIPDIKTRLPITKVLAHYGIKLDRNNHINCPFHEDDKPSCKIYPETGTFHCFGCGATGDQIEFIERYEKCSKHEALKKATELAGEEKIQAQIQWGLQSASLPCRQTGLPKRRPTLKLCSQSKKKVSHAAQKLYSI